MTNKTNTPTLTIDNNEYKVNFTAQEKEAVDLAMHSLYRIDNGSIIIRGNVDKKDIIRNMLEAICTSFIDNDKHFVKWLEEKNQAVSSEELGKYFQIKK